jgi:FAD:protein FMN transferase
MKIFKLQIYLLILISLFGCNKKQNNYYLEGKKMKMPYKIIIADKISNTDLEKIHVIIDETFDKIDKTFNFWNPSSELSLINQKTTSTLSPLLYELLLLTDKMVKISDRYFDPTVGIIKKLWQEKALSNTSPDDVEVEFIKKYVGWEKIKISSDMRIEKSINTKIDLSAIAKGFSIDLLAKKFLLAGLNNFFIQWGGEIRCHGNRPDGGNWKVQINTCCDNKQIEYDVISMTDESIASSGQFMQTSWMKDNINYFHIIDPITKEPLISKDKTFTVSVVAKDCAIADAIATTSMAFNSKEIAKNWAQKITTNHPHIKIFIISN